MKIAIMAPLVTAIREPQLGGSQAFVSDLARGLADRGHMVHVYAASGSEIPGVTVIDTGVDARALAGTLYRAHDRDGGEPASGSQAAEVAFGTAYAKVRNTRYDVIHNHAFDAPAVRFAAELPVPVLHTVHLPPDTAVADALRQAMRASVPPTVATVSAFQAKAWREMIAVDAILRPCVPTRSIPWSRRSGHGAVFAGRLSPEKGAAEAIDIAGAAGIPIDVYGDTYDVDYAREEVGRRAGRPGVTVHQAVPRASLWEAMARAAVVLFPARWDEPFGMAAAEAHACGTPVVAFRRGGLSEVIADGVTGFLVSPGDLRACADAVAKTAGISRAACRGQAESHLDLRQSLDAHERLYRKMIISQVRRKRAAADG
ncbi:MAG: glycosyltransferase [Nocardiopsaceae bacterium]|jgi:glycosyltransferase involved in cell wall biosynthesis|nr:glycosyltransferase [Nocardiopsaceae bacterium]